MIDKMIYSLNPDLIKHESFCSALQKKTLDMMLFVW